MLNKPKTLVINQIYIYIIFNEPELCVYIHAALHEHLKNNCCQKSTLL